MKTKIVLMLTLMLLMSLAACNRSNQPPVETSSNTGITSTANTDNPSEIVGTVYQGPLSSITYIGIDGTTAVMEMSEVEQEQILSILNSGNWINDVTDCADDYRFTVANTSIRYHSSCGTFIDMTNGCSMKLSETDKEFINNLFGA